MRRDPRPPLMTATAPGGGPRQCSTSFRHLPATIRIAVAGPRDQRSRRPSTLGIELDEVGFDTLQCSR